MKRNLLPTIFLIFIILIISNLNAKTEIQKLLDFSQQQSRIYKQKREAAYEIARQQGWEPRIELPDGQLIELQAFTPRGRPLFYITHNVVSAKTISTDKVHPGGSTSYNLTGSGITLHEWDGGSALTTHQELTGRVTIGDSADSPTIHPHATHVAGTMIASGVDSDAKGMSYQANLKSFDWSDDTGEMAAEGATDAIISNHSYGFVYGWYYNYFDDGLWAWLGDVSVSTVEDNMFGSYTSYSQQRDQIAYDAPYYLIFQSAGNERDDDGPTPGTEHWIYDDGWVLSTDNHDPDGPWDCLGTKAVSKNVMAVGAVNDIPFGYGSSSDVVATSFSSWGPPDDGRIKPDIVTNGEYLKSCVSPGDTDYAWYSGTSMSSPSAAGSAGLLQQYFDSNYGVWMLSSTLKALIIHTADEAGPDPGPDYMFGWGLMNTKEAIQLIDHRNETNFIFEESLSNSIPFEIEVLASGTEPLIATLCWADIPGTPPGDDLLNPTDPILVNDLDLRITRSGFIGYPWKLDRSNPTNGATNNSDNSVDNVEQVYVESPSDNIYTITVSHKGTLVDPQDFSLIIGGIIIDPPEITVNPTFLDFSINEDTIVNQTVNIDNSGIGNLYYNSSLSYPTRDRELNNPFVPPEPPIGPPMVAKTQIEYIDTEGNENSRTDAIINYDDDNIGNGIGNGGVFTWLSIARFTADELASYYGSYAVKSLQFVINNSSYSNVTAKIFMGGSLGDPGTEIYSEDVTDVVVNGAWTIIPLSSPIPLTSGNEYWLGYSISATGDQPAGCGTNSAITNKGDVIYWGEWTTLTAFGIDRNWHIRGVLTPTWVKITANEDGTVAGTGRADVDVALEFNSNGMAPETIKTAQLNIFSNDPDESVLTIPITMTVGGTEPDTPINFEISIVSGTAHLSWDLVAGSPTYSIYSDTDPDGSFSNLEVSGLLDTNWIDINLGNSKKFYIVKANN